MRASHEPDTTQPKKRIKLNCPERADYHQDQGLRWIKPYDHTFESFAKGRWIGKTLYHVFISEFRDRSHAYYGLVIDQGRIRVNGSQVSRDYVIKNGDVISHAMHRHEPPVLEIVQDTDDMLVVNKPPSIPVHPTGRYTHNSLVNILMHEHGYGTLHPINRIDRLTSGIVLLAKNKSKASQRSQEMMSRSIRKTYLARVRGNFPEEEIICEEPLAIFAHKLGVNHVSSDGKESKTIFKKRSFNGRTSVVECRPLTGRTHQIRVHLQFLGFPIANDPLYASNLWGPDGGKGNLDAETLARITSSLSSRLATDPKDDEEKESEVALCFDCAHPRLTPDLDSLSIWLHSVRYEGEDWSFETLEPEWAAKDFEGDSKVMLKLNQPGYSEPEGR